MLRRLSLLTFALLSLAAAQAPTTTLSSPADVAGVVATASEEVLFYAPTLRSQAVAEALRAAAVSRGVKVYLLVSTEQVDEPAAYTVALSMADTIYLKMGAPQNSFLVVDRHYLVEGPLVATVASVLDSQATYGFSDTGMALDRTRRFLTAWQQARAFTAFSTGRR